MSVGSVNFSMPYNIYIHERFAFKMILIYLNIFIKDAYSFQSKRVRCYSSTYLVLLINKIILIQLIYII